MIRRQLGTFCTARSTLNEFYKQFSSCAEKIWSPLIEAELDKIFKERIDQGNKLSNNNNNKEQLSNAGELTNAELSLIDDIVAHLHDEQVQEIASELALEQQQTSTTTTTSTAKPALAILQATQLPVQAHQTIGKLAQTDAIDNSLSLSIGAAAAASSAQQQQHQRGRTLAEAASKPAADVTVIEIEQQTVPTLAPTLKASADIEASSLQRQLNSLAGADSVIPQSSSEVSKPPQAATLTLIESSSPPQQVAPSVVALPPTTSQPLIVIVENLPATQSPVLVAASAAEQPTAFSPSLGAASAHGIQQQQLPLANSAMLPLPAALNKAAATAAAAAAATTAALAVGQSNATGLPVRVPSVAAQALSTIDRNKYIVDSAASNIVDNLKHMQDNPNPLSAAVAQHEAAAASILGAATTQPVGAPQVPIIPGQLATSATFAVATTATSPAPVTAAVVATASSVPPPSPIEPTSRSSLVEQAVNLVSGGSATSVGLTAANSVAPILQPTLAPTNQAGASPMANLLLKSINLPATNASVAPVAAAAAIATGELGPPGSQPIGAVVAANASAAALSNVGPAPLAVDPIPNYPTTVAPPPAVVPAPPPMQEVPPIGTAASASVAAAPPTPLSPPLSIPAPIIGDSGMRPTTPILNPAIAPPSNQQVAVAAVAPPLPGAAFKAIEPVVLKNIDSALDMIAKPANNSSTQVSIMAPTSSDNLIKKSVSVTKLELLTTSTAAPKPAERVKGVEIRIMSSGSSSTTGKPAIGAISVKKATNSSPISVLVESKQFISTNKPSTTTLKPTSATATSKPSTIKLTLHKNGEKDLIRLSGKYGKAASVHDVIVVGEHVEGDDRLLDYDDHSDHHDEPEQHDNDDHGHHDSHGELKLEHKVFEKKASKSSSGGGSSTKLIKIETKVKKIDEKQPEKEKEKDEDDEELQHHDHEHLLKGLLAGDVIHVDAGEPDKSSD